MVFPLLLDKKGAGIDDGEGGGAAAPSAPAAPTGLTATPFSTTQIDLTWTDNATDETGYKVYRSTDDVTYAEIDDIAADLEAYSDTTILAVGQYYYKVAAYNGVGETLSSAAPVVMPFVKDLFAGANGTNLTAHAPNIDQVGTGWTNIKVTPAIAGTAANNIQANQAKLGPDNHGVAIETSEADVEITADWIPAVGVDNRNSILVRYSTDGNMWFCNMREANGDWQIVRVQSDTSTVMASGAKTWNEGQTYAIKVEAIGNTIVLYSDSVELGRHESATFNNTATKHGLLRNMGADATRFDNLIINPT